MNNSFLIKEKWNKKEYKELIKYLLSKEKKELKSFNSKIINTNQIIIGIDTKTLRDIAKSISKGNIIEFLNNTENTYFEETLIEGFVIGYLKDEKLFREYFYKFIEKIDNWATCDMCISSFKIIKKIDFYNESKELTLKDNEFISRVGIVILLDYYIDENHIEDILKLISKTNTNYYYVNMAISWLISIAFIKFRTNILELLKQRILPVFVQNKAISKIRDSYQVSKKDKELVKEYKLS